MSISSIRQSIAGTVIGCVITSAQAGGKEPHADIWMQVQGGQIITGSIVDDVIEPGVRVFGAELGEVIPHFASDPGFNAPKGSAFSAGSTISFNIVDALRRFDPVGIDFDEIPAETMTVSLGAATRTTPTTPGGVVAGFTFAAVGPTGAVHQHLNFFLNPPQSSGVYVLALEIVSSSPSVAPSEPFYIVFNDGASEEDHDAAIDALNDLLAPACAGDTNADLIVNVDDLNAVLTNWQQTVGVGSPVDLANNDGIVNVDDLNSVLGAWGTRCGD